MDPGNLGEVFPRDRGGIEGFNGRSKSLNFRRYASVCEGCRMQTSSSLRLWRWLLVVFGLLLPYGVRFLRGSAWARQYAEGGFFGVFFVTVFQALPITFLLALSFRCRTGLAWFFAVAVGLGVLAWSHWHLDLAADAQAALGLVAIPIAALVPIALAAEFGLFLERRCACRPLHSRKDL